MKKVLSFIVCTALLFLGLNAKDTVKVGVVYDSDTLNSYYHPRFIALDWDDTIVYHNQSGIHTTAGIHTPGPFPTFSTTPGNPYFQFSLTQAGKYQYFDQNQGQQINGLVFQNAQGVSCDVNFTYQLDSTDSTNATYKFALHSQSGSIARAFWDYHDGSIDSTTVNSIHQFSQSGLYEVSVTVKLSNGCYASYTEHINVYIIDPDGCEADFVGVQLSPTEMKFYSSATTNGANMMHNWYFDNFNTHFSTNANPSFAFPDTGWYEVCLVVEDTLIQCVDTLCKQVYLEPPVPCNAQTSYIQNSAKPLTYQLTAVPQNAANATASWYIDGQLISNQWTFSHSFYQAGSYLVKLIVTDSAYCNYQQTDTLQVQSSTGSCSSSFLYAVDSIFASLSVNGAAGGTAPFTFSWDFGPNANPRYASGIDVDSVSFSTTGYELVSLITTDANGCVSQVNDTIFIPEPYNCDAGFTYEDDSTLTINFVPNLVPNGHMQYFWDFGDGNTSTQAFPSHTYASSGRYGVSLTISDTAYHCFETYSDSLYLENKICSNSFSARYIQPNVYTFNSNTPAGIYPFTHTWYIPGGTPDTVYGPAASNVSFPSSGNYEVCLETTDSKGCIVETCDTVYISGSSIQSNFTIAGYSPSYYQFLETVTASAPIASYHWDFGDGDSSNLANPIHTFQDTGRFKVCLTATDTFGISSEYCRNVTVNAVINLFCNPSVDLSVDTSGMITVLVNSHGLSSAAQYSVSLSGYATYYNQDTVYYNVASAGNYQVNLTVTDTVANCNVTVSDTITYAPPSTCFGGFTVFKGLNPYAYGFAPYVAGIPQSQVDSLIYDFGDGSSPWFSLGFSALVWPFPGPGTYEVCLTFVGQNNCFYTYCDSVEVADDTCITRMTYLADNTNQLQYNFYDQSLAAMPNSRTWYFGDGDSSNLKNPVHVYSQPGTYVVELHTVDATGCVGLKVDTIVVQSGPTPCDVSFTYQAQSQSSFNFYSTISGAGGTSYNWDFGDGTSSNQAAPSHNYSQPGNYLVCVEIVDQVGCTAKYCDWVTIYGGNCDANFAAIPDSANGMMDYMFRPYFAARSSNYYQWVIDGIDTLSGMFVDYSFSSIGWHEVCLAVIDTFFGVPCVDTVCRDVYADTIFFAHVPEFKTHAAGFRTIIFDNNTVSLDWLRLNSNAISFSWDFGDGATTTLQNPIHVYADTGLFEVCLTVEDPSTGKYRVSCDSVMVRNGLGLDESAMSKLELYPNPSTGMVNLSWIQEIESSVLIEVYDYLGRIVLQESIRPSIGKTEERINVSGLAPGVYQVSLRDEKTNRKLVTRLLKQ